LAAIRGFGVTRVPHIGHGLQVSVSDKPADGRPAGRGSQGRPNCELDDERQGRRRSEERTASPVARLQALAVEPVRMKRTLSSAGRSKTPHFLPSGRCCRWSPTTSCPDGTSTSWCWFARPSRASNTLEKAKSVEGRLERKRLEHALANQPLVCRRRRWRCGMRKRTFQQNPPTADVPPHVRGCYVAQSRLFGSMTRLA